MVAHMHATHYVVRMRSPQTPPAPAVIRLRLDRFDALTTGLGLTTDTARAERIGLDRATVSRVRSGDISPGERFIAGCLSAFSDARFEDLFTVETAAVSA